MYAHIWIVKSYEENLTVQYAKSKWLLDFEPVIFKFIFVEIYLMSTWSPISWRPTDQ